MALRLCEKIVGQSFRLNHSLVIYMDQKIALDALKLGYNVYLTGPAGSGKTFLLNKYIDFLRSKGIKPSITASTGIAATHMGGITIHSWSGIGIRDEISDSQLRRLARNVSFRTRMAGARVLIIDEISMLHAHQLDNVDRICRRFKNTELPFGGLQVIICGDFFQLPPVNKEEERAKYAFESEIWHSMNIKICYLSEQHRQNDNKIISVLNDIRSNQVTDATWETIMSRVDDGTDSMQGSKMTRLFTHKRDVNAINNYELELINGKPYRYTMRCSGNDKLVDALKKGCLAPEELILKKGAKVMFVKNNLERGYVNGTVGTVDGFEIDSNFPIVKLKNGKKIVAKPETWVIDNERGKILADITQIPLCLAWAITVHKSQGMTLDSAEVDLGRSFEYGMGYVALSRVRALDGLKLLGINDMALQVHPDVLLFDRELMTMSGEFCNEIEKLGRARKWIRQREFIKKLIK